MYRADEENSKKKKQLLINNMNMKLSERIKMGSEAFCSNYRKHENEKN